MSIQALGQPVNPDTFLSLFSSNETGALGASRFRRDFFAPETTCVVHTAFTTVYSVTRGDIFCSPERVVVPFTTLVWGQVKYGPTRAGNYWLVYLQAPDWSSSGWAPDCLVEGFTTQHQTLLRTSGSFAASDPRQFPVRSWSDEDCIKVRISAATPFTTTTEDDGLNSEPWSTSGYPIKIGDTICCQCTLHTYIEAFGEKGARTFEIQAVNVQTVTPATRGQ